MPDIKAKVGSTGNFFPTNLNLLADGSGISSPDQDNSTEKALTIDLMLKVAYTGSTPAVGTVVAEIFIVPAVEGTNFAEGYGGSPVAPQDFLVARLESRNPSTSVHEYLAALHIPLPLSGYRVVVRNTSGRAYLASGNALNYRTNLEQG